MKLKRLLVIAFSGVGLFTCAYHEAQAGPLGPSHFSECVGGKVKEAPGRDDFAGFTILSLAEQDCNQTFPCPEGQYRDNVSGGGRCAPCTPAAGGGRVEAQTFARFVGLCPTR